MSSSLNFNYSTVSDVTSAPGCTAQVAELAAKQGFQSLFIISDQCLQNLGIINALTGPLDKKGINYTLFTDVKSDPSDHCLIKAVKECASQQHDAVIGIGGGSPMDVAKMVAVLANNVNSSVINSENTCESISERLQGCYGVDQLNGTRKPLYQIPTTAGTGSEASMVSILTTGETTKAGVVSRLLLADHIFLDPLLTLSLPPKTTGYTAIDSMVHAIESYTSKRFKNPMSDMLAKESLRLLSSNIVTAVEQGDNIEARSNMLLGAMLGGQAFANAPVGGVHALAYPLGGIYHIPHGLSNALVLPAVLRHNGKHSSIAEQYYAELLPSLNLKQVENAYQTLADYFHGLSKRFNIATNLQQIGIELDAIGELTESALLQQRLLINNPVELFLQRYLRHLSTSLL